MLFKKDKEGAPEDGRMTPDINNKEITAGENNSLSDDPELELVDREELEKIMIKYDKESAYRRLSGFWKYVIIAVSLSFTGFQLYTAIFGMFQAQVQRGVMMAFITMLVFLLFPASKQLSRSKMQFYDVILAATTAFCWGYIVFNYRVLIGRIAAYTELDIVIAVVGILLLFEACRRVVGLPIMIITACFLVYANMGYLLPGFLNHRGYSVIRIATRMFYELEGIMGTPVSVCAKFIFLFILFAAFLEKTGLGQFFIDLANTIAGSASGGPAKVAVISSALMGTISGSSVANTVGSGSFTIPMMKKLGYKPEFAGAVEAAASTGGQLMPPIMGAAAFLMAESLGVPYLDVVKAAIVPALLYFTGVFIVVHFEAHKLGLKGEPREKLHKFSVIFRERGHLFVPLAAIIYFLCAGYTASFAALMGLVFSILAAMVKKSTRLRPKDFLHACVDAPRNMLSVGVACGMAGMIIGVVTLTGLGLKMGSGLVDLAGGSMILTLIFTMLASLILGMGAPTTANYLITSTITAPAIVAVGVVYGYSIPLIAAHMFAFYFGIIADVTPPVCLAAMAGSAIAKGRPVMTGVNATKLACAAFLIPYIFVYNPEILMVDATVWEVLFIAVTAILGMIGIGSGLEGWFFTKVNPVFRIIMIAAGLGLIIPGLLTDLFGLIGIGVPVVINYFQAKKKKEEARLEAEAQVEETEAIEQAGQ